MLTLKATLNKLFFLPANPHGAVGISENRVLIQRSLKSFLAICQSGVQCP